MWHSLGIWKLIEKSTRKSAAQRDSFNWVDSSLLRLWASAGITQPNRSKAVASSTGKSGSKLTRLQLCCKASAGTWAEAGWTARAKSNTEFCIERGRTFQLSNAILTIFLPDRKGGAVGPTQP